jgi:PAS domain S-box-containing protein
MDNLPNLLSISQTSELLNVHPNTLRRWDNEGFLKAVRVGDKGVRKYRKEQVLDILNNSRSNINSSINQEIVSLYKDVLDAVPAMVGVYNLKTGQYIYVNKAIKKLLGYTRSDFMDKGLQFVTSLVHPEDLEKVIKENQAALEKANKFKHTPDKDPIVNFEYRMKHKNGKYLWLHTDGSVFSRDSKGKVESVLNVSMDITQRKLTESNIKDLTVNLEKKIQERTESLSVSEERYRTFIQQSSEGIWRFELEKPIAIKDSVTAQIDQIYKYAYLAECNDILARMYGFKKAKEIVGIRLSEIMPRSDKTNIEYLTSFINSGYRISDAESHEITRQGKHVYFQNNLVGIVEDGFVKRAWGTQVDVTEKKKIEDSLKKREQLFSTLTNFAPVGIFLTDEKGDCQFVNRKWTEISGMTMDEAKGQGWVKAIHPEDKDRVFREWYDSAEKKLPFRSQYRFINKKNGIAWLDGSASALISNGKVTGYLGTITDITEVKNIQQKIEESEARYKNIFDTVPVSIWEQDFSLIKEKIEQLRKKGVRDFEKYFNTHPKFVEWAVKNVKIVDVNDETVRMYGAKNKEDLLKSLDKVFLPETRKVFIRELLTLANNQKIYSSETVSKKLTGEEFNVLFTIFFPDNKSPFKNVLISIMDITQRKRMEEELFTSEQRLRLATSAGKIGVWDWHVQRNLINWSDSIYELHGISRREFKGTFEEYKKLIYPEDREKLLKAVETSLKNKQPYKLEFRAYGPNKSIIWISTSAHVIFNNDGEADRMIGVTLDITERKKLEQRKDDFIALASHELKTPVTSLKMFTQILAKHLDGSEDEKAIKYLTSMDKQISKLSELVSGLLDVSRAQAGKIPYKMDRFSMNTLVIEIVKSIEAINKNHKIQIRGSVKNLVVADRQRIGQVLINLINNAIKYSPGKKRIIITLEKNSDDLIVSVEDFGMGIPDGERERIFERFFQAQNPATQTFPGLGLGLYISKEIIEQHGGRIWVNSREGKGSTFYFTLPLKNNVN